MLFLSLLFYLSAIYIRPGEIVSGWEGFPFVQVITAITVVIGVLTLLLAPRRLPHSPLDGCVLGFYVTAMLSNLAWGWFGGAYKAFLDLLPVVFGYFLIRITVQTDRQLKRVVFFLVLLTLFQAVNGIVQYHTGMGLGNVTVLQAHTSDDDPTEESASERTRIRGTGIFNDPNDLAMTLVVAVPFALSWMLRGTNGFLTRIAGAGALALLLVGIYYTNSRGGIIGLGAVMVAYAYQNHRKTVALVIAVLGLVAITRLGPSRTAEISSGEESAQTRIQAWAAGLTMLREKPVFGVGYSRFTDFHERVAHNSFVHTFAELGIVGTALLVGMFYFFFMRLRDARTTHRSGNAAIGREWNSDLTASGVGLVTCALFLSRQYNIVPYIVLALGACLPSVSSGEAMRIVRLRLRDIVAIVSLTFAGIVATYVIVRTLAVWSGT